MQSLSASMQEVLDLAGQYSKDASPAMQARDAATKAIALTVQDALTPTRPFGDPAGTWRAVAGGRQSNYSPVPWVRIFLKQYSPRATEGYYLVYLFAADGSRVYLSLNQGTSEFRSGATRPITDPALLTRRAVEARGLLADLTEQPPATSALLRLDLARHSMTTVGSESRIRIRNYEDANILAWCYEAGGIPSDEQLLADIAAAVPLLEVLYGAPTPAPVQAVQARASRPAGTSQGRQLDPEVRRAIEQYAVRRADAHFTALGWTITDVGTQNRGYDLEGHHPDHPDGLHIEVKGTQTIGEEITLTPNEVRHLHDDTGCGSEHVLFVVSQISVRPGADGNSPTCHAGIDFCLRSWTMDHTRLTPTAYRYSVPTG